MRHFNTERVNSERGAVSSEFAVIMAVFFTSFVLVVVYAGRVTQANNDVRSAAQEAARAASLTNTSTGAVAEAQRVAAANLVDSGLSCADGFTVNVDTANFTPGGNVSVAVTCHTSLRDLAAIGVPGTKTFAAKAVEVIDTYRASP